MSLFSAEKVSELHRFWRESAPVPGRMQASLRFGLMAALATLLLLILQPPAAFIAPSMFMLFLVSHDTPRECFKGLLTCLTGAALGTTCALLLMIATGNHPVARVLGLAIFTFISAFFFRTCVLPAFPMAFGCLTYMTISLWEYKMRDEKILHLSLWPMGTLGIVALSGMAVEILFNRSRPLVTLRREIKARCAALQHLFHLYATGSDAESIQKQSAIVRRYAVTGEGRLHVLLGRVANDRACDAAELTNLKAINLALDRILLLAAGFAVRLEGEPVEPTRFERIEKAVAIASEGHFDQVKGILGDLPNSSHNELDRIERTLRHLEDSTRPGVCENPGQPSQAAPSGQSWKESVMRFLLPDTFTNYDHFAYALKLSLCATIAYVVYNGLAWPGISTAFFTVYFTGLSTTGTTNRKLFFRIVGSTFGGMILGIGCLVFVFPNLEGVQGFLIVIAAVSALGSWLAAGPYFGYLGFQITFSFNLIAFEQLRIPNQMTPARDRLLGIAIGFLVMFFIFHQVRPERTIDTMRRLLARLLRAQAELIRLLAMAPNSTRSEKITGIRNQVAAAVVNLQNFAHAVQYEFPPDRDSDMRVSNEILNAIARAAELLAWVGSWPVEAEEGPEIDGLREIRNDLGNGLRELAQWLGQAPDSPALPSRIMVAPRLDLRAAMPIYLGKAIEAFQELQMVCEGIVRSVESASPELVHKLKEVSST